MNNLLKSEAEEENNVINIDGAEYNREDMTDHQNYYIEQVKDLQLKRQQAQFQVDQLMGALDFFTKALMQSLAEKADEEQADQAPIVDVL
jgi:hypothetical protein